jgi:hypothetical protein
MNSINSCCQIASYVIFIFLLSTLYAHARAFVSGLAIKNCTSASALSPRLPLERRESGCKRVYRSDSLDTLMQEERAHFRVDAILAEKAGPLFVLLNLHRCGE